MVFRVRGFLSVDIDVSELEINQCNVDDVDNERRFVSRNDEVEVFHGSHKCHRTSMQVKLNLKKFH